MVALVGHSCLADLAAEVRRTMQSALLEEVLCPYLALHKRRLQLLRVWVDMSFVQPLLRRRWGNLGPEVLQEPGVGLGMTLPCLRPDRAPAR